MSGRFGGRASDKAGARDALSTPEQHQKKIALSTLKMNDVGANIMGGMTKEQARAFLKRIGYSDARIADLEK
jgi:hypothetical protein